MDVIPGSMDAQSDAGFELVRLATVSPQPRDVLLDVTTEW
jgi:hypothetical protein